MSSKHHAFAPRKDDIVRSEKEALEDLAKYDTPSSQTSLDGKRQPVYIVHDVEVNAGYKKRLERYTYVNLHDDAVDDGRIDNGLPSNLFYLNDIPDKTKYDKPLFVPSLRLTSTILRKLVKDKKTIKHPMANSIQDSILQKYCEDHRSPYLQNMTINWKGKIAEMVYYPTRSDLGDDQNLDDFAIMHRRSVEKFAVIDDYKTICLDDVLKHFFNTTFYNFLSHMMGVDNMRQLLPLQEEFGKPIIFSLPADPLNGGLRHVRMGGRPDGVYVELDARPGSHGLASLVEVGYND